MILSLHIFSSLEIKSFVLSIPTVNVNWLDQWAYTLMMLLTSPSFFRSVFFFFFGLEN